MCLQKNFVQKSFILLTILGLHFFTFANNPTVIVRKEYIPQPEFTLLDRDAYEINKTDYCTENSNDTYCWLIVEKRKTMSKWYHWL